MLGAPDINSSDYFGPALKSSEWDTELATVRLYLIRTDTGDCSIYISY